MERTEEGRDLIETLWNVKKNHVLTLTAIFHDLIETLWNVKRNKKLLCYPYAM